MTRSNKANATMKVTEPKPITTMRGRALGKLMKGVAHELVAACAEIDALPEFASDPDGMIEARVLRKVAAYREWLVRNGLPPASHRAQPWLRGILEQIGHAGYEPTRNVKAEIASLGDLLPAGGPATAPFRPKHIDVLADIYSGKLRRRKFGLPRNTFLKINWPAVAEEMGCALGELTQSVKGRLRVVDLEIGVPGPTVGRAARQQSRHNRNPAVGLLLATELARRVDGLPADPMHPGEVDVVELAYAAGISIRDLTETEDADQHFAAIEAARAGKPLVPHPLLKARRFTYRQLKEFGRGLRKAEAKAADVADPDQAARQTVAALTQFQSLAQLGGKGTDLVPLDFPERVARAIASKPTAFGSGWRGQINRWISYFHAMRSERQLPENWTSAVRILASEVGASRRELGSKVGQGVKHWLSGLAFPTHQSEKMVRELEDALLVTNGTLTKGLADEWRMHRPAVGLKGRDGVGRTLPGSIVDLSPEAQKALIEEHWWTFQRQGTVYTQRLAEQIKSRYRLRFQHWPSVMQSAWEKQTPDEAKGTLRPEIVAREPGQRPTKEDRAVAAEASRRGWRKSSMSISKGLMEMFFGYLVRSTATPPGGTGTSENGFKDGPGLGMPRELIHPVVLAVVDLMGGYKFWRRDRSGGQFAPHIAFTMRQAAAYLKPGTGLVWKNPSYLAHLERFSRWWEESGAQLGRGTLVLDIEAFRENWHAAVEDAWKLLLEDAEELKPNDPDRPKIRNPFEVLDGYLANPDDDPMAKYMVDVRNMLASKPLTALDRHRHRRNSVLTLILVQTALRAGTLLLTVSGPEQTLRRDVDENGVVRWRITIPAARFKNFYSPYFSKGQPYEFTLDNEDGLYRLLDDYMDISRPYLLAGRESDALFITSSGSDYTAARLSDAYRKLTGAFFVWNKDAKTGTKGVRRHGLHAVRHIVASSLLRTTGDIYLAAWAIQDSAKTVEAHYGRFLPRDKVRLAVEQLRKSRALPVPQTATTPRVAKAT